MGRWTASTAPYIPIKGPNPWVPSKLQDPPCTLNWGYMVPNSRYLGPNRG